MCSIFDHLISNIDKWFAAIKLDWLLANTTDLFKEFALLPSAQSAQELCSSRSIEHSHDWWLTQRSVCGFVYSYLYKSICAREKPGCWRRLCHPCTIDIRMAHRFIKQSHTHRQQGGQRRLRLNWTECNVFCMSYPSTHSPTAANLIKWLYQYIN